MNKGILFLLFMIGVNNQFQRTDIDVYPLEFKQLLNKAIELCGGRKSGVFVLSIPDYGYTPFGEGARATISAEIDGYNRINREIASELGVAYFNITPISREAVARPEYLASDQLHPSGEMYARWVDLIFSSGGIKISTTHVSGVRKNEEVTVYPNPATHLANFYLPQGATEIMVFDSTGVEIFQAEHGFSNDYSLNVSGWKPGIYFYRIKNNGETVTRGKLLIE
jgi:hypothetical protein